MPRNDFYSVEQDQTCTDGAHSTGSDEDSIVKLPDIDAIKDTVVAVRTRSQRGEKNSRLDGWSIILIIIKCEITL